MKKLILFLIAAMLISAMPIATFAQSDDPFEQETLKTQKGNNAREKKISRKKVEETPVTPAPKPQALEVEKPKPAGFTISNSCDEWLDVEFVSLIGSIASQEVKLTIKITNHDVDKHIYVGNRFLAYDSEGNEHARSWSSGDYNALTDVPIKTSMNIPGKINPTKTKVLPVVKFDIGDCRIEMRNVPIDWK